MVKAGVPNQDMNGQGMPGFQGASVSHPQEFQGGFHSARNPIQPIAFHPTSVLHPLAMSPNGFSSQDADRRLYNGSGISLLPSNNGQSKSTYQQESKFNPFRQIGA